MKYVVIRTNDGIDSWVSEYDNLKEAVEEADKEYDRMTAHDRKHTVEFIVLESANPDEEADNHLDGDIIKKFI